jgi:Multicopper oxidase
MKLTIDSHKLYVYAVDGRYITPQVVDQVVVNNGDRYSVMVKLDQQVGQYAIRVANNGLNQMISGFAVLNYSGSSSTANSVMNFAGINTTTIVPFNDSAAIPFPPIAPAETADVTLKFSIKKLDNE